jgi:pilus assembly protein Flp/PilA
MTWRIVENRQEDQMSRVISRFVVEKDGVTAIEYGLIAALVAVVIITAVSLVGTNLGNVYTSIASSL